MVKRSLCRAIAFIMHYMVGHFLKKHASSHGLIRMAILGPKLLSKKQTL